MNERTDAELATGVVGSGCGRVLCLEEEGRSSTAAGRSSRSQLSRDASHGANSLSSRPAGGEGESSPGRNARRSSERHGVREEPTVDARQDGHTYIFNV